MGNSAMFFVVVIVVVVRIWALLWKKWNWGEKWRKEMNLKKDDLSNVPKLVYQQKHPSSTF